MISAYEKGHVGSWIQAVTKHVNNPTFDPHKGVSMTYEGWLDDYTKDRDGWFELNNRLWKAHVGIGNTRPSETEPDT